MKPFVGLLHDITKYSVTHKPINVLEIGVHHGRSTRTFLEAINERRRGGKLYSIDIRGPRSERQPDFYEPSAELKKYWEFINSDSRKVKWDKEIDILLIDGNHAYAFAKDDFNHFEPFVVKGGYILMHDVTHPKQLGVGQFWPEIKYQKIILDMGGTGLGVVIKDK